jgi:hypothetical protein
VGRGATIGRGQPIAVLGERRLSGDRIGAKMPPIVIGAVGLILTLDAIASVLVLASKSYTRSQKLLQILLIWVVPLLGAIAVLVFIVEDWRVSKPIRRDNFDPPENPPGMGMTGGP